MASPPPCPSLPAMLVSLEAKVGDCEQTIEETNKLDIHLKKKYTHTHTNTHTRIRNYLDDDDREGGGAEPLKPGRHLDFEEL